MTREVFICDAVRTPIGRFGGGLSAVRADDLASTPIRALLERNPQLDPAAIDEVFLGSANQAGEDNRNVARMAALLAGLPESVPGVTLNRLCASGMDAVGSAFRAIASGEIELAIAGGVESMSRAPYVMGKADSAFGRTQKIEDTTIGWRFINPRMKEMYGVDAMPETADNVAEKWQVSREDQDAFALRSQQRPRQGASRGLLRGGNRAGGDQGSQGRHADRHRRASTSGHHCRGAGQAQADQWRGQDRHGRQRFGRQRWCGGDDPGQRRSGAEVRPEAARQGARHGQRRRRAAHHGLRSGAGGAQAVRAAEHRRE